MDCLAKSSDRDDEKKYHLYDHANHASNHFALLVAA
jgi:hypothetical protein